MISNRVRPSRSLALLAAPAVVGLGALLAGVGPPRPAAPAPAPPRTAPLTAPREGPREVPDASGAQESSEPGPDARVAEALTAEFEQHGIELLADRGLCAIRCEVMVRDDLLEYLVVGPRGASHETMLATDVTPSVLNTALLLLGVEPGTNAAWKPADPPPSEAELAAGASPYEVVLPEGDGFFLYVAWREGEETHWHRMEDLLRNLKTGRSMRRHRWVYLGSRMVRLGGPESEEAFAADLESNLVNLSFFPEGNTLVTGAIEDCVYQTIWLPNAWLLPPRGTAVKLFFARERIDELPADIVEHLPVHDPDALEAATPPFRGR